MTKNQYSFISLTSRKPSIGYGEKRCDNQGFISSIKALYQASQSVVMLGD